MFEQFQNGQLEIILKAIRTLKHVVYYLQELQPTMVFFVSHLNYLMQTTTTTWWLCELFYKKTTTLTDDVKMVIIIITVILNYPH